MSFAATLRHAARRAVVRLPERHPDTLDLGRLRRLLGRRVRTVLEVGANDGGDTLRLHAAFPRARLCAFEPDPRPLAQLRRAVAGTSVEVYPVAVGAHDGAAVFHQSGGYHPDADPHQRHPDDDGSGWHMSGSLRAPTGHLTTFPWVTFEREITVDVVRLDTWADAHGVDQVDFIWADVQGAEIDLIEGGPRTLARTRYLYTECYDTPLYEGQIGLDGILARLPGFVVEARFPTDVLLRNTVWPPTAQTVRT